MAGAGRPRLQINCVATTVEATLRMGVIAAVWAAVAPLEAREDGRPVRRVAEMARMSGRLGATAFALHGVSCGLEAALGGRSPLCNGLGGAAAGLVLTLGASPMQWARSVGAAWAPTLARNVAIGALFGLIFFGAVHRPTRLLPSRRD